MDGRRDLSEMNEGATKWKDAAAPGLRLKKQHACQRKILQKSWAEATRRVYACTRTFAVCVGATGAAACCVRLKVLQSICML